VGEDAAREFVGHLVERDGAEVVRGNERKDGGPGVGGAVHVADVNFVERRLADTEHERTFFFEANVGGAFDQMRSNAVGNARQGSDTAGQHDHRIGRIRTAGDVGADIGVGLLMNFARGTASEDLADEIVAAGDFEFFCHYAERTVGGDEVDGLDTVVAIDGEQQLAKEDCAAGSGGGDGQVLRKGWHLGWAPTLSPKRDKGGAPST